jgi:hypothetical protein
MSVIIRTEKIAEALQERMNTLTFKWKGGDSPLEYKEEKPKVYAFTYDDLSDSLPLHTPSVCVQLLSVDDNGIASYLVHCCVCHSAIQDKEIAQPVQNESGVYEYKQGSEFDSAGVRSELYRFCLLLGEQVYIALKQMANTDNNITNVVLNTPSPYLSEFPYAECTVSFESDVKILVESLNRTALESML